ncbi:MAG: hypothetical protein KDB79_01545 [Acidobacteria bacterium]|nr:hypothetical protein [Acidobacteriota bacterium]
MDNRRREEKRDRYSDVDYSVADQTVCPACGTAAAREDANYCLICGKILSEDYQPLDTLRSAHRLQGKTFLMENTKSEPIENLFARNENNVAHTAWASLVYSMVPYLGVLFIPFTLIFGSFGIVVSYQNPLLGGRKLAVISIGLSFVILAIQLFLWWLLYFVPTLNRGI